MARFRHYIPVAAISAIAILATNARASEPLKLENISSFRFLRML